MTRLLTIAAILVVLAGGAANAACYADYKAKKESPLRLHYGVVKLPDAACRESPGQVRKIVAQQLSRGGWKLLNVMSVFGEDGLDQRKKSAGDYFLRF